jgi:cytochrome P450
MSTLQQPSLVSLANPAILADPYPVLADLREASPFTEMDGALVVAGKHADCSAVLRHPSVSSERGKSLIAWAVPSLQVCRPTFIGMDPPDHTRLRRLVSEAFTPRAIARLEPQIRAVTTELFDAVATGGSLEVVSQLAYPLPVRIISAMLGVPPADHPRFAGWSARLADSAQPAFGLTRSQAQARADAEKAASDEFADYFKSLIAEHRAHPAPNLLSELISAEDAGDKLTEDELIATCILLMVAGHETTVGLISNAILALLHHQDQLAMLQANPDLAAGAVEETLRYDAPVQMTGRVARGDIRVGEVTARDGALVVLLLAATGRDPEVFENPDRFDITRGATGHLAFAAGLHFCVGAPLARLEASIAVEQFSRRVVSPELDEGGSAYKLNLNLRHPERLVVEFAGIR